MMLIWHGHLERDPLQYIARVAAQFGHNDNVQIIGEMEGVDISSSDSDARDGQEEETLAFDSVSPFTKNNVRFTNMPYVQHFCD